MSKSRLRSIGSLIASLVVASMLLIALMLLPWWLLLMGLLLLAVWMMSTRVGQQAWSVTRVGVSTIPQRLGAASVVVVGIAGVVGVLVALLAMGAGFEATLKQSGTDDTAIVMRSGAQAELNSVLEHDAATLVSQAPQVLRDAQQRTIASPELVVVAALPKKSSGLDANVEVRGIGERAWELRPQVKMVEGRKFVPGLRELIVGKGARDQFSGVDIGATLNLNAQTWTVVGVFDSDDTHNSELWADADVVAPTYRRGSSSTSVTVRLTDAAAIDEYRAALAGDPRLTVDVKSTRAYYTDQSAALSKLIRALGFTVAIIMAIGAVFGALNTMYAAVATRAREIATLRAMGFQATPVIVSVLLETMLLALLGGLLGAGVAWVVFDHYTVSTLGANFTQVVFAFTVTAGLLWTGLKWALTIGFIGGLFPALRAARQPVTAGLREL